MRLLARNDDGDFILSKAFIGDDVPRYAILSHTWGPDSDEVTFKDLVDGTGKTKPGYDKIRFCGEQASRDSLQYVWVDTCCIDKSNSSELSEAINSMFRWYQNAARCYVYLPDVSKPPFDANTIHSNQPRWEPAFRKSRWFTRGWTLQELIAPASVEFFSKEGENIGNKNSLERSITDITGIPVKALRGCSLSSFSVAERLSWQDSRETKRKEDKAYSLLGIFDVSMPLIYGEGREKAFKRLREEIDKVSEGEPSPPIAMAHKLGSKY
jgi:Heterokaryon incompatibility protein (HET)